MDMECYERTSIWFALENLVPRGQPTVTRDSTRLPPMWPAFDSRTRRHLWVEFVVGSRPCSERFFSGYSGFPLSSKTNISKFQFDLDYCQVLYHEPLAREIAQALLKNCTEHACSRILESCMLLFPGSLKCQTSPPPSYTCQNVNIWSILKRSWI